MWAQTYIKSHKKKDGSYPIDIIKEICVCYSPFISCFTYVCDNFFTINTCQTHQHLIQHIGEDGRANTNRTVSWTLDKAYAQAHSNKLECVNRVRQVGLNVLPVLGTICSYYTPSQARSQNPRYATISQEFLNRALEAERGRHRVEMDAMLASQA
jgi:hypothetical protein